MKKSLLLLLAISPAIHGAPLNFLRESFKFKNNRNLIGFATANVAIGIIPRNSIIVSCAGFAFGKNLWNKEGNFSFKNAVKSINPLPLFNLENTVSLYTAMIPNFVLVGLGIYLPSVSIISTSAAWSFGRNYCESTNFSHAAKSMVIPTIVTSVGIGVSKLTEQYLKTYSGSEISTELGILAGAAIAAKTLDVCRQLEPHTWLNNPIVPQALQHPQQLALQARAAANFGNIKTAAELNDRIITANYPTPINPFAYSAGVHSLQQQMSN